MLLLFLFFALIFPEHSLAKNVHISAFLGHCQVTIYGYGPPHSAIELTGSRVYASVYSDDSGYFIFDRTILPANPSELCLSAIDNSNRRSLPTCIPPPPPNNDLTDIGPILLSPTLTLDKDLIKPNSTSFASGQSIPNSPVNIYLYQVDSKAFVFPKSVQAFSLPVFSTITDSLGNYSFSLPTAYSSNYRLYSTVVYRQNPSPKSNTLIYHLPSLLWLFWLQNYWLIITFAVFIITLTFFFYLIYIYYLSKPEKRYLPAIFSYPLKPFPNPFP